MLRRGVLGCRDLKRKECGDCGEVVNGIAAVGEVGCNYPIPPPTNLDRIACQGVEVSVAD
jgi:hypothetical protein